MALAINFSCLACLSAAARSKKDKLAAYGCNSLTISSVVSTAFSVSVITSSVATIFSGIVSSATVTGATGPQGRTGPQGCCAHRALSR